MSVLGHGIDLVDIARIDNAVLRFGDRFLARVFTDAEIFYCQSMKHPSRHLAARFAAKEAVSKCFGTGISSACGWKDIEVVRDKLGRPLVQLHDAGAQTAAQLGIGRILLSLTHTETHAAASAVALAISPTA